jgi:3-methyladenine DNA glycosylase AlkD
MKDLEGLKEALIAQSNGIRATQMEAYLKNKFPFYGVMSTPRKAILKEWKTELEKGISHPTKRELVLQMWEEDAREFQLVAVDWMIQWPIQEIHVEDILLFQTLITEKSWWDTVDALASHMVGKFAKKFPDAMEMALKDWENHDSFWIHRTCLIYQLKFKEHTDLERLTYYIRKFKGNKEFFIQKAIGWSLREVSKWNPQWVKNTVVKEELKGLAYREAMKYVFV